MLIWSAIQLAVEAGVVVESRMRMFAMGHMTPNEMLLMSSEKVDAAFETCAILSKGGSPTEVIDQYRRRVAANAARLGTRSAL